MTEYPDAIVPGVQEPGRVLQRHGGCEVREVTLDDGSGAILKRLDGGLASSLERRERFRREVRIHRELQAPGCPRVIASNDGADDPFLLLEKVTGPTLAGHLSGGTRSVRDSAAEAVACGAALAETLAHLHAAGVAHRDLSADNVILRDGDPARPVLIDFGLARSESDCTLTMEGDLLGTLRYAAPEQVTGTRLLPPGPEADVFALGMLLFEMVSGRRARAGADRSALLREIVLMDPPLLPAEPKSCRGLRSLIAAMTARNPSRRPGAQACAGHLRALRQRRSARIPRIGAKDRLRRAWRGLPPQRRRATQIAAVTLIALSWAAVHWWNGAPQRWATRARSLGGTPQAASLLAAAWERRPTASFALQRAFGALARGDSHAARRALRDLGRLGRWQRESEALVAWLDAADRNGAHLAGGWNRPETDPEGLAWVVQALNRGVERHADEAWLLAWRAIVALSYHEQLGALHDLAGAKRLLPDALLLRRFDFLVRLRFGFSERLFPVLAEARAATGDAAEWDLWESLLRKRRGERERALALLERAADRMPAGHPLAARVAMERHALEGSVPPPAPPERGDAVTRIAWARARLLAGERLDGAGDPDCWISLELPPNRVRALWSQLERAERDGSAVDALPDRDPAEPFRPDLRSAAAAARSFAFLGDPGRIRFDGSGTVTLIPDEESTADPGGQAPSLISHDPVFPKGDWELVAELRWTGTGDFGVGLHAGPVAVECDVGIRVRLGSATTLIPADGLWHRVRVTRRGLRHAVELDGETVLAVDDPAIGRPRELLLGVWSPWFSPRFECRALEVRGIE